MGWEKASLAVGDERSPAQATAVMTLAIRRPIGTQRPKLTDDPIFENLPFFLWRVNTSLISLIPVQGKNAAEHTFVCVVKQPSDGHALADRSVRRALRRPLGVFADVDRLAAGQCYRRALARRQLAGVREGRTRFQAAIATDSCVTGAIRNAADFADFFER